MGFKKRNIADTRAGKCCVVKNGFPYGDLDSKNESLVILRSGFLFYYVEFSLDDPARTGSKNRVPKLHQLHEIAESFQNEVLQVDPARTLFGAPK